MTLPPLTPEQRALAQRLRDELAGGDDEALNIFLLHYALGTVAGFLVGQMSPAARAGFFGEMRRIHPEARRAGEG